MSALDQRLEKLTKQRNEHQGKFYHELAKVEEGIKELAFTKRRNLESELDGIATRIQKKGDGETYEAAFVRATETEEGRAIRQEMQKLYADTGI
jgi:hypothetical protein